MKKIKRVGSIYNEITDYENIKPYVDIDKMKEVISNESRKRNKTKEIHY